MVLVVDFPDLGCLYFVFNHAIYYAYATKLGHRCRDTFKVEYSTSISRLGRSRVQLD